VYATQKKRLTGEMQRERGVAGLDRGGTSEEQGKGRVVRAAAQKIAGLTAFEVVGPKKEGGGRIEGYERLEWSGSFGTEKRLGGSIDSRRWQGEKKRTKGPIGGKKQEASRGRNRGMCEREAPRRRKIKKEGDL